MSNLDLNTAETQTENIPDNETVKVRLAFVYGDHAPDDKGNLQLHKSKSSDALMLSLEATVIEGKYARRKFWPRYYMGSVTGEMTEGQTTAVGISRKMLRAIVEAARGFAPADETPAAIKARQLSSLVELDGMEVTVVTGIEKGRDGFDDKTVIKRVVAHGKEGGPKTYDAKAEAKATAATAKRGW